MRRRKPPTTSRQSASCCELLDTNLPSIEQIEEEMASKFSDGKDE
jgi:hypothetical protein